MATQQPMGGGPADPDSPKADDLKTERAVLALLLDEHPTQLTIEEVCLVLHSDPGHANPNDEGERAVQELLGAGLVHRHGCMVVPSRAALYFERLESD